MPAHPACDVLILGGGAAGLSLALRLPADCRVTLLSKGPLTEGSTRYAQGGVSAVLDEADSIDAHVEDTLDAGAGLCRPETVRFVVERGPTAIAWLRERGVPFTEMGETHALHLTREGGHTHRRVAHAADATGQAIATTLEGIVRALPNVTIREHHIGIDLVTDGGRVVGVYALDERHGRVEALAARSVVVATGGASKVYLYSSNPDGSTGDGIAMAWRAGCRVANMEFMQFHPTCLYHPHAKSFLLTEALRGEGGKLMLPDGSPFIGRFDARAELAPRDIVARAIDHEMKRLGVDHVLLDVRHLGAPFLREHFPTVYARCLDYGLDMARDPLPVVPAAHYTCGGIVTDHAGRTDIPGLYAIGECAHTGLHGANRMASNSLLECLVFAESAAADIATNLPGTPAPPALRPWDESRVTDSDEEVVVTHNWHELRRFMWDYVGIVRTDKRLARAASRVKLLLHEIDEYYGNFKVTGDLLELRNLALVAELIIRSAQARKESRGLHYTLDYPTLDDSAPPGDTLLIPGSRPAYTGSDPRSRDK